eukprot:GHRR01004217.1.p1 GENE.GHRR01004217.1~~GHRR01004217.1.p1  ORF type:complete len:297 (+),score=123.71 GHRR01004217.1:203-1093(+)
MAAADYLEKYMDRVSDVPAQLQRHLKVIRSLDEQSAKLQAQLDEKCRQQLVGLQPRNAKSSHPSKRARVAQEDARLTAEIQAGQAQLLSWAEEKMRIAAQVYDLVDKHIRELDDDLRTLSTDIEDDQRQIGSFAGQQQHQQHDKRSAADVGRPSTSRATAAAAGVGTAEGEEPRKKRKYVRRKGVAAAPTAAGSNAAGQTEDCAPAADEAVEDASEPRYCVCRGVSYGEMVACDSEDCPIEWFHYGCVGITEPPKGKWYCSHCAPLFLRNGGTAAQQQQQQQQHQKKAGEGTKAGK